MTPSVRRRVRTLTLWGLVPVLACCLAVGVGALALGEWAAARSALVAGTVLGVAMSATIAMHPLIAGLAPRATLGVALGIYTAKIIALGAVLALPKVRAGISPSVFAGTVFVSLSWWIGAQCMAHLRDRAPIVGTD